MSRKPEDISQYQEAVLGTVKNIMTDPKQGVLSAPLLRRLIALEYDGLNKEQVRALTTYVTGALVKADSPQTAVKVGLSYPNSVKREHDGDTDIFYNDGILHKNKVAVRHEEMMIEAQALLDIKRDEKEQQRIQAEEQRALQRKEIAPSTARVYVYATLDDELDTRTNRHAKDIISIPSPTEGMMAFEALAPIDVLQYAASHGFTEAQMQAIFQMLPDELIAYANRVETEAVSYADTVVVEVDKRLKRPGQVLGMKVQILDSHATAVTTVLQRNHPDSIMGVGEVSRFPYKPYVREVVDRWIARYTVEGIEEYTEVLQASENSIAKQLLEMTSEQLMQFAREERITLESGELTKEAADVFLKPLIFSEDVLTKTLFYNMMDALYPVRYLVSLDPVRMEYAGRALRFVTDLFTGEEMRELMTASNFDEAAYRQQLGDITKQKDALEKQLKGMKRRNTPQAQQITEQMKGLDQLRKNLINARTEATKTPDDRIKKMLLDRTPQQKPNPRDYKDGEQSAVYQHRNDIYESVKYINYHYWGKRALKPASSPKESSHISKALMGVDTGNSSQGSMNRRL